MQTIDLGSIISSLSEVTWLKPLFEIEFFGNSLGAYVTVLLFVAAVWLAAKLVTWILRTQAKRLATFTKNEVDDLILRTVNRSLTFIVVVSALYLGVKSLRLSEAVDTFAMQAVFILLTLKVTYEIDNISAVLIKDYLEPLAKRQKGLMKSFVPTLLRLSKFIIWSLAFLLVLSNLGYNIASLLAGLGLGGLAVALAAQEALGNFFGSISLLTDQPFRVGDFITVEDVSGTVKEIGMRSTKIQTMDKSIVSVPNKVMAEAKIENISRRNAMKVEFTLRVDGAVAMRTMKELIEKIEGVIRKDRGTESETVRVNFLEFAEFSLNLEVFYYIIDTKSYAHMLDIRERINLKIMQVFERMSLQIAYPTRNIYLRDETNKVKNTRRTKARK